MKQTVKIRLHRLEQIAASRSRARLPPLMPLMVIAESTADADRQQAELEATGALVSPDGREVPLIRYIIADPPSHQRSRGPDTARSPHGTHSPCGPGRMAITAGVDGMEGA
jgi:hypothetical protein